MNSTSHSFPLPHSPDAEPFTGLPRMPRALADVTNLTRRQQEAQTLGIVSLFVPPTPVIYRMTPETAHHLRRAVSSRLVALLRPNDRLYSVTHWEWLILMPELLSTAPLMLAMLRLRSGLNEPFATLDGTSIGLEAHCGGALWPDDGVETIHLVQSARIARLHAGNGSGVETYQAGMDALHSEQSQLLTDLPQALAGSAERNLCLYLQGQVSLKTGRCSGAEALLRWPQADGTSIPPHHVIAALDKLGLRHKFARWLLNQAMQIITTLDENGIGITLSINLSASDLLDVELPDLVGQTLSTWDIPARRLRLEITETMTVEDSPQVNEVIAALRQIGVSLAIDDFGTGYSGMTHLQRLPVDEVKIDQRFVRQAVDTERDREIISSITQLSHRLNLSVLAEGVEDAATAALLEELGCEYAQGFFYAHPLPLADFIDWYRAKS